MTVQTTIRRALLTLAATAALAVPTAWAANPMTDPPPTTGPTHEKVETDRNPITGSTTSTHVMDDGTTTKTETDRNPISGSETVTHDTAAAHAAPATRPAAAARNPITGSTTVTHGVFEDDDASPAKAAAATRPAGAAATVTGTREVATGDDAPTTAPAAAAPLVADANGQVDNPVYAVWAKLKPDSTLTWTSDMVGPTGQQMHMVATLTIKQVTADGVTYEATSTAGGRAAPAQTETMPAKVAADAVKKRDGQEQVKATIGGEAKQYTCDVYELSSSVMGNKEGRGGPKMTAYVSADAPGGLVKMTAKLPWGKDGSIDLTGADVK